MSQTYLYVGFDYVAEGDTVNFGMRAGLGGGLKRDKRREASGECDNNNVSSALGYR